MAPTTITAPWSTTSASAIRISGRCRTYLVKPPILIAAARAITAPATTISAQPWVNPPQIGPM